MCSEPKKSSCSILRQLQYSRARLHFTPIRTPTHSYIQRDTSSTQNHKHSPPPISSTPAPTLQTLVSEAHRAPCRLPHDKQIIICDSYSSNRSPLRYTPLGGARITPSPSIPTQFPIPSSSRHILPSSRHLLTPAPSPTSMASPSPT